MGRPRPALTDSGLAWAVGPHLLVSIIAFRINSNYATEPAVVKLIELPSEPGGNSGPWRERCLS
jgi:hypothetical protein